MSEIKFLVFADLHYKKMMYATKVSDLEKIMKRAEDEGAELVLHEGDFCNDYIRSPEIFRVLHGTEIPVFGVYGNHELETMGNTMQVVTPRLTNAPENAIFGTSDGKIGDGSIGYYYYDTGDFRFIFLDANYSLMPDGVTYEHNREGSWGAPMGNSRKEALGTEQLVWLENVLNDAAENGKHCIVNAHPSFTGVWQSSPDHKRVRELYAEANARRAGTVMMSINGHYHTNRSLIIDNVFYLDTNVAINGWWQSEAFSPYAESDPSSPVYTFDFTDYNENGESISTKKVSYSRLAMGSKTLFFTEPLSAVVTVTSDGEISVKGSKTEWAYGIVSDRFYEGVMPEITDRVVKLSI